MGLREFFRGTKDEQRSLPRPENELPLIAAYTASSITPLQALAIGDVWAAVRVLADAASSLPIHVYRKTADGRELVTGGRLVDLLEKPAPATTQSDLVSTLMSHLLIWGNAFLGKYREGGDITQIAPLYPDRVTPELDGGQLRWRYSPPTGPQTLLTDADLVHIKGLSIDGVLGLSPVTQAANVLGLSEKLVRHALSYFDDGSTYPGGIPRPAGILNLGYDATNAQQDIAKEHLRNVARPHGILVLRGEATYTPVATSLDSQQFAEQRRLTAQEIARVFRIPPHMLGAPSGDSLTYATVEQQSLDFVRFSLAPWLRRIELAISGDSDLAFARQYVKFEVDALLRGDSSTRAAYYTAALNPTTSWLSRDEVRRLEDLEPEPRRPAVVVPTSLQDLASIGASNGNNG